MNAANASDMTWFAPLLEAPFSFWGSPVSWAEITAFVLSLAMVGCNLRVNPLGWPLAIVASLLYAAATWPSLSSAQRKKLALRN